MANAASAPSRFRIVTWNCRSGSAPGRLDELARYRPHLVFLQECDPESVESSICARTINAHKAIGMFAAPAACRCEPMLARAGSGRAVVAVRVDAPVRFTAIGIWAQATNYAADVVRTLRAHADLLRSGPAVVTGDFNSGPKLARMRALSSRHAALVAELHELGLVSAYHAFHRIEHGHETHATYFHQYKPTLRWHIDFCFVPKSWTPALTDVRVVGGGAWRRRSDHRPVLVEVDVATASNADAQITAETAVHRRDSEIDATSGVRGCISSD